MVVTPFHPQAREHMGASFVSRYHEVKIGEIGGWRQEEIRLFIRLTVVNPRARALFHSRKRPFLVGTFPGKKSQHTLLERARDPRSVGRRMPACKYPITTHGNGIRVITEMQRDNSRSPDRGESFDPQAIVCPSEVFVPNLRARIE